MLQTYSSIKKEKRGGFYELMLKLGSSNSMDLGKSWNTSSSSSSSSSVSSHSFYVSAVLFMSFRCSVSIPKMALFNFSTITPSFDDDLILKFSSLSFS